jgi:hypothetical protein
VQSELLATERPERPVPSWDDLPDDERARLVETVQRLLADDVIALGAAVTRPLAPAGLMTEDAERSAPIEEGSDHAR